MCGNNKVIFINKSNSKSTFFCTVCGFPVDDFSNLDFKETCSDCYLTFIESRKKEWLSGWRPSKSTIKKHIYNKEKQLNKRG